MKTIDKITFKDLKKQNCLDSEALRMIRGGVDPTLQPKTCGTNYWKNGSRVKCFRNMSQAEAIEVAEGFLHDADGHYYYDNVYWCCDSCTPCP